MLFALLCQDKPGALQLRLDTRPIHVEYLDSLNKDGKLAFAGETAAYYGILAGALGGIYYGLDGHPEQDCVVTEDFFSDCLIVADDFTQYWMGAYDRTPVAGAGVTGIDDPLTGVDALFGGPATEDNPNSDPTELADRAAPPAADEDVARAARTPADVDHLEVGLSPGADLDQLERASLEELIEAIGNQRVVAIVDAQEAIDAHAAEQRGKLCPTK